MFSVVLFFMIGEIRPQNIQMIWVVFQWAIFKSKMVLIGENILSKDLFSSKELTVSQNITNVLTILFH